MSYHIGFDLDGVVYPFHQTYRDWLAFEGIRRREECPDPQEWRFFERWGQTEAEFLEHYKRGVDDGFILGVGVPLEGAAEAIRRAYEHGHQVHLITDRFVGRPGQPQRLTVNWLRDWGIPYHHLHFTADKARVRVDFHVDDKAENWLAMTQVIGGGSVLLSQPWNDHVIGARRVNNLTEYMDIIEGKRVAA